MELRKYERDTPKAPPMTMQYLTCETAAYFGLGIDDLKRKPMERRAEMMAHLLLKDARDGYIEHLREDHRKTKEKNKGGYNPADAQRRKWMI